MSGQARLREVGGAALELDEKR
ncbi:hypothetical protein, partial [Pseudomonas aeruginosa]